MKSKKKNKHTSVNFLKSSFFPMQTVTSFDYWIAYHFIFRAIEKSNWKAKNFMYRNFWNKKEKYHKWFMLSIGFGSSSVRMLIFSAHFSSLAFCFRFSFSSSKIQFCLTQFAERKICRTSRIDAVWILSISLLACVWITALASSGKSSNDFVFHNWNNILRIYARFLQHFNAHARHSI